MRINKCPKCSCHFWNIISVNKDIRITEIYPGALKVIVRQCINCETIWDYVEFYDREENHNIKEKE
jgi:hypothetical protein